MDKSLPFHLSRMQSIGFFLDILYIGIKLANMAIAIFINNIIAICRIPKFNTDISTCVIFFMIIFNPIQANIIITIDKMSFILEIIILSFTNIANTSLYLAPNARSIPLSFFLLAIEVPM